MRAEIYTVPNLSSGNLSIMAHPRGWDWLEDEVIALQASEVNVVVSLLTREEIGELGLVEEQYLCQLNKIEYIPFPIPDRGIPPFNQTTISFIEQLSQTLNDGKHVAIHCRAGIGRSALIAASVLVLTGVSTDNAFNSLATARGRPVPDTEEQREWVTLFEKVKNDGS